MLTVSNFTAIQDGDVADDNYLAIRDSAVILTIDAINYNTGVISGSFVKTLTFGIEFDPASPDTFTNTNGHYEARVIK